MRMRCCFLLVVYIDPGPWRYLKILKSQSENYRVVKGGGFKGRGFPNIP